MVKMKTVCTPILLLALLPAAPGAAAETAATEPPLKLVAEVLFTPAACGPEGEAGENVLNLDLGVLAQQCSITCFTHNCSIQCDQGERANCACIQVKTPTGFQFLPRCFCSRSQAADSASDATGAGGEPAEPAAAPTFCTRDLCDGCLSSPACEGVHPGGECTLFGRKGTCVQLKTCALGTKACCGCQLGGRVYTGDGRVFAPDGRLLAEGVTGELGPSDR